MVDIEKEIRSDEKVLKNFFNTKQFWMYLSIILVVALVVMLAWPNGMSSTKVADTLVSALNEQVGGGVVFKNISSIGSLYVANVIYQGQEIPVYVTLDGKYMVMGVQPIGVATSTDSSDTTATTKTEVVKSAKPVVDVFVFSYCPYGLQFQKALSPVYDLLKDKAEINLVAIGAMHGEFERQESLREMCIQKLYGKDKLWDYLNKFMIDTSIGACNGDETCLKPLLAKIYVATGIDSAKVDACMPVDGAKLYDADVAKAASFGISGSPGFMINGVEVSVSRSPEAVKAAICDSFTTAPSACSQTLSTAAATPSFGSSTSSSSAAASCG